MRTLLCFLLVLAGCSKAPMTVDVTFPEAGGIKPGDNVTMRGLAIGQVTDVDLAAEGVVVRVEIDPRYQRHLDARAAFAIAGEKLVTGKKMLTVTPGVPPGEPLRSGAVVRGAGLEPDPIEQAKGALTDSIDHARSQANGLGRALLNPDQQPPRALGDTIDLDRPGHWVVRLLSVRVYDTTADGSDWDGPGGGGPDLLVQVWYGNRQVLLTPSAEDVLELDFDAAAVSEPVFLDGHTPVRVKVLDADMGFNDPIGVVEFSPTVADANGKRVFRLAAGRVAELRVAVEPAPVADAGPTPVAADAAP